MAALASSIQKSFELSARQNPNYIYQPPIPAEQNFFNQQNVYGELNNQQLQSLLVLLNRYAPVVYLYGLYERNKVSKCRTFYCNTKFFIVTAKFCL